MKVLNLVLILILIILLGGLLFWIFGPRPRNQPITPEVKIETEIKPSESMITYTDPAGFTFDYPDNLSIARQEVSDPAIYSSLQLYSKQTDGSLNLTIEDTKLKSITDWMKQNNYSSPSAQITPTKLGSLDAQQIKTADRTYLIAIDKGILFSLDLSPLNEQFWQPVFQQLATNFAFGAAEASNQAAAPVDEIFFESEETVE